MGTRLEKVVLDLDDRFSREMREAAKATALLNRELNALSGRAVQTSRATRDVDNSVTAVGVSSRRAGADIDRFSGRLAMIGKLVAVLGPGLVPISAVAIPAVTGLASQLGFAAVGAGSFIVAIQGVGDALTAVNDAALDPTQENLDAAREAMSKLVPEARKFVREFQEFRPVLGDIQEAAARGWFPGLTESLDHLAILGPRVADIFEEIGEAGGALLRGGAESLAGDRWADFLDFIEREAPSALTELGHTLGDLTHGLAEMWMAFDPINTDFSGWLRGQAQAFDQWASALAQTQGFTEFVEYLRTAGPQVSSSMSALANALLDILQAAAPLGGPVLAGIEAFSEAVSAIANSELGTPIMAAVAAMSALSLATAAWGRISAGSMGQVLTGQKQVSTGFVVAGRHARTFGADLNNVARFGTLATDSSRRLRTQLATVGKSAALMGGLAIQATGAADGIGLTNTASLALMGTMLGPWGFAVGTATGLVLDWSSANDELMDSLKAVDQIISTGNLSQIIGEIDRLQVALASTKDDGKNPLEWIEGLGGEPTNAVNALNGALFRLDTARDQIKHKPKLSFEDLLSGTDAAVVGLNRGRIAAEGFTDALEELNAVLSGRADMRNFEAAIDAASQALKDNGKTLDITTEKGRTNQAALDGIASSALSVAEGLNKADRKDFLSGARKSIEAAAVGFGLTKKQAHALAVELLGLGKIKPKPKVDLDDSGNKAGARATQRRMAALDALKANPNADLDDAAFRQIFGLTSADLRWLNNYIATSNIRADAGQAISAISSVKSLLDSIPRSVTSRVTVVRNTVNGGRSTTGGLTIDADGGFHENGVRTFASGGFGSDGRYFPRQPMMARGGANILWGEKETGWEAYISGKPSERKRNVDILGMAAGRLGVGVVQAANGRFGGKDSTFQPNLNDLSVNDLFREWRLALANASQGMGEWTREIRSEVRGRLKEAEARKKATEEEVAAAKEFRDSLRQAAASLSDTIGGKFRPGSDLVGEDATLSSIIAGLGGLEQQGNLFDQMQLRLSQLGLDDAALQFLLENSTAAQLQAFAGEGAEQIALFERQFNATNRQAQQTGQTAAFLRFGEELSVANKELRASREELREANQHARKLERRMERMENLAEREVEATKDVSRAVRGTADNAGRRR